MQSATLDSIACEGAVVADGVARAEVVPERGAIVSRFDVGGTPILYLDRPDGVTEESQRPFDLSRDLMLRARLLRRRASRLGPGRVRLPAPLVQRPSAI